MSSLPVSASSPSALCLLPQAVIKNSPCSKWLGGNSTKLGGCSPHSLPGFSSGSLTKTAGLGACEKFGVPGRIVPMRVPTWWWLWRYHGAQTLQDLPRGGCGRVNRGSRKVHSVLLYSALPFGTHQHLDSGIGRTKLLTCPAASSGRGGDAQVGSSGKDFGGSLLRTVQEIPQLNWLGFRGFTKNVIREKSVDEGDWRYSPEWWGTQAGGWGHSEGETVFEAPSVMGNGVVSVTSHPASTPATAEYQSIASWSEALPAGVRTDKTGLLGGPYHQVLGYEWRVLRFNSVTRQSVAKVKALVTDVGDIILLQQPNCIAFEYVKSMISAGLSAVSLCGLDVQRVHSGNQKMHILCIGLGGGSLPLFLAHNLPGATVEVAEIDATVISAAVKTMGFPPTNGATKDEAMLWGDMLERIILHDNDGEAFVCEEAQKVLAKKAKLEYDLVFVDAYDGQDVVPLKLWDRNGPFLSSLSSLLNADHGTVVVNLHTDSAPPSIIERISGKFGPGFDPTRPQGKRVQEAALAYRDILLKQADNGHAQVDTRDANKSDVLGLAFTVAVSLQGNISLVVSRLASTRTEMYRALTHQKANTDKVLIQALVSESERVQRILNTPFDMSKRVQRGFQIVKS